MIKRSKQPRVDLYQKVTDEILKHLENGVRPWVQSWTGGAQGLPQRATGEAYRGINIVMLWCAQLEHGYASDTWMTFRQASQLGANVRKGEKGHAVVFFSAMQKENDAGEAVNVPFLRQYTVFNCDQVENLPDSRGVTDDGLPTDSMPAGVPNAADSILYATGANISHGGGRAYYVPKFDRVQLPEFEKFRDADAYSSVLAHELIHWSGASHRLNRRFDDEDTAQAYAREELVAEMGAAFVCATLGIAAGEREDHASYIAHWLKLLRSDKRAVLKAAALAQTASDFLLAKSDDAAARETEQQPVAQAA